LDDAKQEDRARVNLGVIMGEFRVRDKVKAINNLHLTEIVTNKILGFEHHNVCTIDFNQMNTELNNDDLKNFRSKNKDSHLNTENFSHDHSESHMNEFLEEEAKKELKIEYSNSN